MQPRKTLTVLAALTIVYALSAGALIADAMPGSTDVAGRTAEALVAGTGLLLAWLIAKRVVTSSVPPALATVSALAVLVPVIERWGRSAATADPWPAAQLAEPLVQAIWPWQLVGFVLVLLAFPAEPLRRPVAVRALLAGGSALLLILVGNWGTEPDGAFAGWRVPVVVVGLVALVASVLLATVDLIHRSRGAGTTGRQQARWLLLATGAVVILMIASWIAVPQLVPADVGYAAFLVAVYVLVPGAVAIAVIRHDLLDIDRLLGDTAAIVATSVVAALAWAGTVVVAQGVVRDAAAWETGSAAFVTALVLVPAYRWAHSWSAAIFDRERTVLLTAARKFAAEVHQGAREPEEVEEVLRVLLRDPGLRVGLAVPGRPGYVDPSGEATDVRPDAVLRAGDAVIGTVELTRPSTRQRRLAQETARACWSAFESARLRAGLRAALVEVAQSRTRLEVAASDERRRLERDLHDGAQQALIAIGMRLRSAQARLSTGSTEHADVETAIGQLGETVGELRRISQGIRPARLDDGLGPALEALQGSTPLPIALRIDPAIDQATLAEPLAQAAYFVIAEAVANALKHAHPSAISVEVDLDDGGVRVSIVDDGVGGVDPKSGLVALRDRIASVGGTLEVESPPGGGTRLKAVL